MEKYSIKDIKQLFFTYRNGIIADTLRNSGNSHNIIFGLNIPQIAQIAQSIGKDEDLAIELWNNNTTRESQLLAPYIYPIERFTIESANNWIDSVQDNEVADILCHKLLRYTPYANQLILSLIKDTAPQKVYIGLRLALNLLSLDKISDKTLLQQAIKTNIHTDRDIICLTKMIESELNSTY